MAKTEYFKFKGDDHRIDSRFNHFVNGKCVNPKAHEGMDIGDTHPSEDEYEYVEPAITVTGFVPHRIEVDKKGNQVFVVTN